MTIATTSAVQLDWQPAVGDALICDRREPRWRMTLIDGLDALTGIRSTDDVIPFLPGVLWGERVADSRRLLLKGVLFSTLPDAYRASVRLLTRAFDPTLGPGVLTATTEDGGVRTIIAYARNIVWDARHSPIGRAFTIELVAEPFWRSTADWGDAWTLDMGLYLDDDWTLDTASGVFTMDPDADPFHQDITTLSTTWVRDAIVTVTGPSDDDVVVHNADGIGFRYPQLGSETLVIDSGARTALVGMGNVRADLTVQPLNLHGEFFRMRPGVDTITVLGEPVRVTIAFRPIYV